LNLPQIELSFPDPPDNSLFLGFISLFGFKYSLFRFVGNITKMDRIIRWLDG